MIIGDKKNEAQLLGLIPSIKNFMWEWQIVTVKIPKSTQASVDEIVKSLYETYKQYEGVLYPVKDGKIVLLVRMGLINNYSILKTEIEEKMPKYNCRVMVRKMSTAGLKQIQIDLSAVNSSIARLNMFDEREKRRQNKVLIVDDDMFVRKTMKSIIGGVAEVVEVDRGDQALTNYLKHNPDVVLLDIHMPNVNGLDLVDELLELDPDAFIVIFSADSVKENVLAAIEKGAVGFLSKPPIKGKLENYLQQCITFH